MGTEGRGLARLDPRDWAGARSRADRRRGGRVVAVGTKDGLFDDAVHQILEDGFGRIWMNGNRGISWVERRDLLAFAAGRLPRLDATSYTERDGLRNREGNGGSQPAGARTSDGRLWFPTVDGVAVIDPARIRRNVVPPPVAIEQVVAGRDTLPVRDAARGSALSLGTARRDLEIGYTALSFLAPANVRFRYRLEPYDRDWIDAGSRRTAFYTRVPPGRYTFRVVASNNDGVWNDRGAALALDVQPYAWETTAFRAAVAGTLLGLAAFGVHWRVTSLRARSAHLERVVEERTAALREREHELAERNAQLAAQADQLQTLDRAKSRFFANVSHEFRTPLALTIGPLEDLRVRAAGDAHAARWLDVALRNARRLLRLVDQLLDVAKLDAGRMRLAPRPMDLAPFVRGIAATFERLAERRSVSLRVDVPPDGALRGALDPDAVEKIVTNLLSNALKFTPAGGRVTVAVERDGEWARLHVADTGPGFSAEQRARLFERFAQVDESVPRTQPGTGIGLSLVKELAELHGGAVTVHSDGPGTGARFTVVLPLAADAVADAAADVTLAAPLLASAVAASPDEDVPANPAVVHRPTDADDVPTLLIVDDSADLRAYVRDQFVERYRILEAADGVDGVELARRHLPDVVISDVMMPRMDGHQLLEALRGSPETDFLSIVLLTARAEAEQRIAGLERSADDYVAKPFEARELRARVENLFAARRRLRARLQGGRERVEPPAPALPGLPAHDQALVDRIRSTIEARLDDPEFGVAELAKAAFVERSHLFRRTRELLGESPSELLRRARLDRAARLLREGAGTVAEVAYGVGFQSVSHFSQSFREAHGVSPSQYRESRDRDAVDATAPTT